MTNASRIESLEKTYTNSLETISKDLQKNPGASNSTDKEHILHTQDLVEHLSRSIRKSLSHLKTRAQGIEELFIQMTKASSGGEHRTEKSMLIAEYEEAIKIFEAIFQQVKSLINLLKSPVFGFLELELNGDSQKYYISKNAIATEEMKILSSDWRSPIGQIYYGAQQQGDVLELQTPRGNSNVKVLQKKTLKFRDGELLSITDPLDDKFNLRESLSKELAQRKGGKFKDIVHTIQKGQDEIIRLDPKIAVSIQGSAGSGKTSVAIHRLSQIFFDKKHSISADHTTYITPNRLFSDYLEDIKTALGLEGVQFITYLGWASALLFNKTVPFSRDINIHPKLSHSSLNYAVSQADIEKAAHQYVKETILEFNKNLRKYLRENYGSTKDIEKASRVVMKDEFSITFAVETEMEAVKSTEGITADWNHKILKLEAALEFFSIYEGVVKSLSYESQYHVETSEDFKHLYIHFSQADLPGLLQLRDIAYGRGAGLNHMMVIDEAQNYSSSQISSLLRYVHGSNFSIVGDIHQQTNPNGIQKISSNASPISNYLTDAGVFDANIRTCYRTTRKIMEFSYKPFKDMLNKKLAANEYYREGEEVEIFNRVPSKKALEKFVSSHNHHTVAVVSDHKTLKKLREELKEQNNINNLPLLEIGENNYQRGIFFLEPNKLTGLEFDALLYIGDLKEIEEYKDWKTASNLHVIMSRALHSLAIVDTNPHH